jgi:hypothetical protein
MTLLIPFVYRFAEQKAQMNKQEKELQSTMVKQAQELKNGEIEFQVCRRF